MKKVFLFILLSNILVSCFGTGKASITGGTTARESSSAQTLGYVINNNTINIYTNLPTDASDRNVEITSTLVMKVLGSRTTRFGTREKQFYNVRLMNGKDYWVNKQDVHPTNEIRNNEHAKEFLMVLLTNSHIYGNIDNDIKLMQDLYIIGRNRNADIQTIKAINGVKQGSISNAKISSNSGNVSISFDCTFIVQEDDQRIGRTDDFYEISASITLSGSVGLEQISNNTLALNNLSVTSVKEVKMLDGGSSKFWEIASFVVNLAQLVVGIMAL